jgi:curved DNA-binding protein CbpA
MTLYELLGINENANEKEITNAYRSLAKIYHPDMESGNKEKFIKVQSAYETLIDPNRRSQYDKSGKIYDVDFWNRFEDFTKEVIMRIIMKSDIEKKNLITLIVSEINVERNQLKVSGSLIKAKINKLKEVERRLIFNKFSDKILIESIKKCMLEENRKLGEINFDINFLNSCQEIVQGYDYNFR